MLIFSRLRRLGRIARLGNRFNELPFTIRCHSIVAISPFEIAELKRVRGSLPFQECLSGWFRPDYVNANDAWARTLGLTGRTYKEIPIRFRRSRSVSLGADQPNYWSSARFRASLVLVAARPSSPPKISTAYH